LKYVHAAVVCFLLALLLCEPAQSATPPARSLAASVQADDTVRLTDSRGRAVTRVKAGRYVIRVLDRSPQRGFALMGLPTGLSRRTGAAFVGAVTWRVSLKPGLYGFGSDAWATRTFRVVA
jgi:hypothetical protein